MDTNLHIKLGFKVDNVYLGWHDGTLYQLPYMGSGRYFGLRKLKCKTLKNSGWQYYHIKRKKYGMEKIKALLQQVDWEVKKPIEI